MAAPTDPDELRRWKHGELVLAGEFAEGAEGMLLCPSCDEEDASHAYDEGAGD